MGSGVGFSGVDFTPRTMIIEGLYTHDNIHGYTHEHIDGPIHIELTFFEPGVPKFNLRTEDRHSFLFIFLRFDKTGLIHFKLFL